jgi:hypothetical protein
VNVPDKVGQFANIGCDMIDIQLTLSSIEPEDALQDLWTLGYCFGVFDAIGQRGKLSQEDTFSVITVGFFNLLRGPEQGGEKLRIALDNQTNTLFQRGVLIGGSDIFAWLSDRNKTPMGLTRHLGPPAA